MKQAADVLRLEKETAEKLAAKAFAKSYLADLVPSVFNNLRENGYFYDPVQRDLETGLMPWIMENSINQMNNLSLGRLMLDSLLREVVSKRSSEFKNIADYFKDQEEEVISVIEPNNNSVLPPELLTDEPETSNPDEITVSILFLFTFEIYFLINLIINFHFHQIRINQKKSLPTENI